MRYNANIFDTWETADVFAGDARPYGVITVDVDWYLNATAQQVGSSKRGPYRWFQRSNNSQTETIVPNVRSIQIDRSIDQDAASMTFTITNTQLQGKTLPQLIDNQFGQPGYFTFDYGSGSEAQARWGQTANSWAGIMKPNALFRSYQGFYGTNVTNQSELDAAIDNDGLIITGCWLADRVTVNSQGDLSVQCRDMAKLLIEQKLFPPLVPLAEYPLEYRRWYDEEFETELSPAGDGGSNGGIVPLTYKDSSGDRWGGPNAKIHGHRPTDSLDNNSDTWAMSVGNGHPSKSFCCFGGETLVLTKEFGYVPIRDLAGRAATVVSRHHSGQAQWVSVPFRNFGTQNLHEITLSRYGIEKTIRATGDHRWFVKKAGKKSQFDLVETQNLVPGSRLAVQVAPPTLGYTSPSKLGIAAGLVYGDGSAAKHSDGSRSRGSMIELHEDSAIFATLFEDLGCNVVDKETTATDGVIARSQKSYKHVSGGLPASWKDLPSVNESTSYLYGWLAGYFAADGHVSKNGEIIIRSTRAHSIEYLVTICDLLGIGHYGIKTSKIVLDGKSYDIYSITLTRKSLPDEFFLLEKHVSNLTSRQEAREMAGWKIVSVVETDSYEDVFCAVVPENHNFVIDGNILTHNCDYFEYEPGGPISSVYIHPWMGNYELYFCILEDGVWQGDPNNTIFYDQTPLYTSQPSALNPDTGADTPYVIKYSVPWEEGQWYDLPRLYNAQRLRVTFRNHQKAQWGPFYYRCGIREIQASGGASDGIGGLGLPQAVGIASYDLGDDFGYRIADHAGKVTSFGQARDLALWEGQIPPRGVETYTVDIAHHPSLEGYWTLDSNGVVRAYGNNTALYHAGSTLMHDDIWLGHESNFGLIDPGPPREVAVNESGARADITDLPLHYRAIVPTYTGDGYWLILQDASIDSTRSMIEAHGDAPLYYDNSSDPFWAIAGFEGASAACAHPSAYGLWVVSEYGFVYAYGSCLWYGNIAGSLLPGEKVVTIRPSDTGLGYHILGSYGTFASFGDATTSFDDSFYQMSANERAAAQSSQEGFLQEYVDFSITDGYAGGYVMKRSGEIYPFGDAVWFGNMIGLGFKRTDGNYSDYSDVVKDLLLWSGWHLYEDNPSEATVFGGIETTGAHAGEAPITADFFDKRPVIDCINEIKEIAGYCFFIDSDGGAIFRSPNWWAIGNFDQNGAKLSYMPEIDERTTLFQYSVTTSDEQARSEIIIGDRQPEDGNFTTRVTRIVPPDANLLRGIIKPAIWTNEAFISDQEQRIMAELISLHIWFQRRQGSVTAVGNPCIMPDDQVRIFERTTGESYVHYVRGVSSTMDLDTGDYRMNLTTHWLGEADDWVLTRDGLLTEDGFRIDISSVLVRAIKDYASANNYGINGPGAYTIASNVVVTDEEGGGPGE